MAETLDVVWAYRPDDPRKQGKTETLPADLAKLKVSEGLARWPVVHPAPEAPGEPAGAEAPVVTGDAADGVSVSKRARS